ncbi:retrovirus-related pol polyprotein from transposon TNT 1-94 [Tanacetum coccineum]
MDLMKPLPNAHVDVSPGADIPPSLPLPTDMFAGVSTGAPTGPSTVSLQLEEEERLGGEACQSYKLKNRQFRKSKELNSLLKDANFLGELCRSIGRSRCTPSPNVSEREVAALLILMDIPEDKKKLAGVGLIRWGDLKVLMDSPKVNDGSDVWKNQHTWSIQSWKLYSFFSVHVLEIAGGLVLHNVLWTSNQTIVATSSTKAEYVAAANCCGRFEVLQCCSNKEWLVQGGTALGKDIIKSVDGCDDLPKIIRECGASESAGVYVSSLHSQHHAHMCFCCFLMLVKCFAAVPISIPSGRTFIVPAGRYVVPAGRVIISFLLLVSLGSCSVTSGSPSGPKVVFGDDSTCTTEGYGSIKCNGIVFTKVAFVDGLKYNLISISQLCDAKYIIQFDEKRETIFNSIKEVVMTAPRVRDVYVLDMTSSAQESCFFAKASENLNWLWHKRFAHLNFKTINKLAKQNLVIGLPSLVYSKDKPCSSCEKGKHHRASFKTKHFLTCDNPSISGRYFILEY